MPQILADRFMTSGSAWIDLATGGSVRLRLVPAGSSAEQNQWSARCAILANLRHPVINPLIDYGAAGTDHLFEAYAAHGPLRAGGGAAERLLAHAVRFLRANEIALERPLADFVLRPVDGGPAVRLRPVGVVLQRRGVFDAIADALDAARPGGACALSIEGNRYSGLRTLRLAAARTARLQGYVPIAPLVLRAYPWLADRITGRHVCVVGEEDAMQNILVGSLLVRLCAESARRHVLLAFRRPAEHMRGRPVRIDPMGVTAMSRMVFVDPEQGPRPEEVFAAARGAEGRPGRCLASLGACAFEPLRTSAMVVHELPQLYAAGPAAPAQPVDRPANRRTAGLLQRSIDRGEMLARRGRHASAHRVLSRATRVLAGRGQRDEAARTALLLGWLMLDRGRLDVAIHAFEQARSACPAAPSALVATVGLGIAWTDDGKLMEAEAALRTAMVAAQGIDHRELTIQAAAALGRCLYWLGRFDEAAAALRLAGDLSPSPAAVRILSTQARVHLAEGLIPAAVRAARSAVEMATLLRDARVRASACRVLAAAVASAGDIHSATSHIADGLRAAATAHLPLEALRLRLTSADIHVASGRPEARRVVSRVAAGGRYPRLLRFFARAVFARVEGMELDAPTKAFLTVSGAATIARSSLTAAVNPVADLETFLELGHAAPDDRAAIERIGAELQTRLRAATVLVVAASTERRVLSVCGRPWHGDPQIAWRAAGGGVGVAVDPRVEPCQAAEPLRYSGDIIGALAARWTAGTMLDAARATSLLRVGALALAANVRAVLDRAVPETTGPAWGDLLGDSPPACALREAIARAARAPFPVLIQGESGSGKELVARGIHRLGTRRDRRFCALNCAALSDDLIEAELFGHARGAFTGAVGERPGLFEDADGGTLFLDEIAELSARAQAKLLRVLQDGEVRRVGENVSRRVDVRIVAATNRRLDQEAAAGRFRADLRFRLDVVRIDVPPLRDRSGDVPLLASRFWNDAVGRVGSRATLSPDAVAALARYEWPGNVRELQNVMAWMAVHSPRRGRVGAAALPRHVAQAAIPQGGTFEAAREEFERRFIRAALASADGQRARAAEALGITRQGLAKMMRRLGLDRR
jgi:DNA-binding NtrC family response regulator/tetratricopeptide (TPR) repeat protein